MPNSSWGRDHRPRGKGVWDQSQDRALAPGKWSALPTAGTAFRGGLARTEGGAGVADTLRFARKTSADAYEWAEVGLGSSFVASIGPWYLSDIAGTATAELKLMFMSAAGSVGQGGANENDITLPVAGEVVGAFLMTQDPRTAGTATLRARLNTVDTALLAGAVVLDGTHTLRASAAVARGAGLALAAGDELGLNITTASYTPAASAHVTAWVMVRLDV
jgi:hypothetical protein